jgi:hypothetical protein
MSKARKIDAIKEELARREIPWESVVPPLWRLSWRCGFVLPPPLFAGFMGNFLVACTFLFPFFLFCDYVLRWSHPFSVVSTVLRTWPLAVIIGAVQSVKTRREANRLGVPKWSEFR